MLFQNLYGHFIEIKRCDYKNDSEYYKHIIMTHGLTLKSDTSNTDERLITALNNKLRKPKRVQSSDLNRPLDR